MPKSAKDNALPHPQMTPANWNSSLRYRVEIPATDALPCVRISLQLTIRPCEDNEALHRYHPGRDSTMRAVWFHRK